MKKLFLFLVLLSGLVAAGNVTVVLNAPGNNSFSTNRNVYFNFTPASESALVNCSLWLNDTGLWVNRSLNTSNIVNNSPSVVSFQVANNSDTLWNIECYDILNNSFASANRTVRVDSTAPVLAYLSTSDTDGLVINDTRNWFFVNASFVSAFPDTCTLTVNSTNYSMTKTTNSSGNGGYCSYNNTGVTPYGNYSYFVTMNSSGGLSNTTSNRSVYAELCRTLTTNYTMVGNASKYGATCFNIDAANVQLNCNGNWIVGNDTDAVYGVRTVSDNSSNVTQCIISDFDFGIYYLGSNHSNAWNNTLLSNVNAIYLKNSRNVTMWNNEIRNQTNYGIVVYQGSAYANMSYNNVSYNNGSSSTAFDCDDSLYCLIYNNTAIGNGFQAALLEKNSSYANISYNFFDNNTNYGIWLSSNSSDNWVAFNTVQNHSGGGDYGVRFGGGNGVSHNNVLTNNTLRGNFDGYFLDTAQNNMAYNESISASGNVDIYVNGTSQLTMVDSYFTHAETTVGVAGSNLTVNYSVRVNVTNATGVGVSGAALNFSNVNNTFLGNLSSDSSGLTSFFVVTAFNKTSAGVSNHTSHNFSGLKFPLYLFNSTTSVVGSPFSTVNLVLQADTSLPSVTLSLPVDGQDFGLPSDISFSFTASDNVGFKNCGLYSNDNGVWGLRASNSSVVVNGSLNTVVFSLAGSGSFLWNVVCTDSNGLNGTASVNYSIDVFSAGGGGGGGGSGFSNLTSDNVIFGFVNVFPANASFSMPPSSKAIVKFNFSNVDSFVHKISLVSNDESIELPVKEFILERGMLYTVDVVVFSSLLEEKMSSVVSVYMDNVFYSNLTIFKTVEGGSVLENFLGNENKLLHLNLTLKKQVDSYPLAVYVIFFLTVIGLAVRVLFKWIWGGNLLLFLAGLLFFVYFDVVMSILGGGFVG